MLLARIPPRTKRRKNYYFLNVMYLVRWYLVPGISRYLVWYLVWYQVPEYRRVDTLINKKFFSTTNSKLVYLVPGTWYRNHQKIESVK